MPYLNIRKNGTTYQVPLMTSAKYASPTGVPCFCAYLNGTVYYALTSSLSTNAVAAFRYGGETYYLVTRHEDIEISGWTLIYSRTAASAATYTLDSAYAGRPIKIECAGGAGSSGSQAADVTLKSYETYWTYMYMYLYGGTGGSGGNGGTATTYVGECDAGTVFTISLANGNAGSQGGTGSSATSSYSTKSISAAQSGGLGGSGGTGFYVSCTNAAGATKTCRAYGGGGGGGGGGVGSGVFVHDIWVDSYRHAAGGAGGDGGASGSNSGKSGGAGYSSTEYQIASAGKSYYVNKNRSYGAGGDGGSSGSSTSAYCKIYAGSLR